MDALSEALAGSGDSADSGLSRLIFVQGVAGTGKTVLLSHLFYRIATEMDINGRINDEDDEDILETDSSLKISKEDRRKAYILVNHNQQMHVYNQIASKLGLQKHFGEVALKPSQFINRFKIKQQVIELLRTSPEAKPM